MLRVITRGHLLLIVVSLCFMQCGNPSESKKTTDVNTVTANPEPIIEKQEPMYTELLNIDFILGQYNPAKHESLSKIPIQYTDKADIYLHKEALDQFIHMYEAAKADGINLVIRSATRNFNYQKSIWEAKWNGSRVLSSGINAAKDIKEPVVRAAEIMKYSAMPGASRHHWGTDIDMNAFDNAYFESGKGKLEYDWLVANANTYGFYQVYTPKGAERPSGYEEEKWHWTYKPVSKHLTAFAKEQLSDTTFHNFSGSELAPELKVVSDYVLGIHPNCH